MSAPGAGFVANLFLNAHVIGHVVEYWLRNHLELTLLRNAPHPEYAGPQALACHLIARVYHGVDDIVLVGQGSLAISRDSAEPRYVHYLNFIQPAAGDFTLALPVTHFLTPQTKPLLASLLALYMENENFWYSALHAATLGEHHFAHFRVGGELAWRTLFSPLAYGLEIACRLLVALCKEMAVSWYYHEAGGIVFVRAMLVALTRPRNVGRFHEDENVVLASLRAALEPSLNNESMGAVDRMSLALACLERARREMQRTLAATYHELARQFNRHYCLDDVRSLPWQHESQSTLR